MVRSLINRMRILWMQARYCYLQRGFSIISHLTVPERIVLYRLVSDRDISACLEIGSYVGASAYFIAAGLAKHKRGGKLCCIDTWNNDAMTEGQRDTYAEFTRNTAAYADYIIPVRGFSTEVVEQAASQVTQPHLLFIDGDHGYTGVKADWDAYKAFLKPGSVVVFHDWGWAEGVKQVIEEDVKPLVAHCDSLPNMWWGTIKA